MFKQIWGNKYARGLWLAGFFLWVIAGIMILVAYVSPDSTLSPLFGITLLTPGFISWTGLTLALIGNLVSYSKKK